jgi:hypothetical protein
VNSRIAWKTPSAKLKLTGGRPSGEYRLSLQNYNGVIELPFFRFGLLLALCLSGCATPKKFADFNYLFDAQQAAERNLPGSNTIVGQGFLRQIGGTVVTCAGSTVWLMPISVMSASMVAAAQDGYTLTNISPQALKYTYAYQANTCDAQGSFHFENIPSGEWAVLTSVFWGVPTKYNIQPQGGYIYASIQLDENQSVNLILSDPFLLR